MPKGNRLYFASDFHLGIPDHKASRQREDTIVRWLDMISRDAAAIYLMGDVFDFWFEYRTVIPKGFIRLQGKLAQLTDAGIEVFLFKGNHDMWMFNYFTEELGIRIIPDELVVEDGGKRFFLHHGDGLGPGDGKYKFLKSVFRSRFCQWLFARLHPNLGIGIAALWSGKSRLANGRKKTFHEFERKWITDFTSGLLEKDHYDYIILGHRHLPLQLDMGGSCYVNLGEWINYRSYAVYDGNQLELKYFESQNQGEVTAAG